MEKGHLPWYDFIIHGVNRPKTISTTDYAVGTCLWLQMWNLIVAVNERNMDIQNIVVLELGIST
jgi:hypothetical protein